jgi:hypothetical protein
MRKGLAFAVCFLAVFVYWRLIDYALLKASRSELRIGKYHDRVPSI